jgi:hypothetical protein
MRVGKPVSPPSFSPVLPISSESLGAKSQSTGLESLFRPSVTDLSTKAQDGEDSRVNFLAPGPQQTFFSLPLFVYEGTVQYQCQVSETPLNSPPKGASAQDTSLPSVEDRTARANTPPESPSSTDSEISFNGNQDGAKNVPSSLNLCEASQIGRAHV